MLCEAVRKLALRQYGLLAATVLNHWGVRSTSDIGDIVYNLIAAGDLEKTPSDSRSDFDNVFDFDTALRPKAPVASRRPRLNALVSNESAIRSQPGDTDGRMVVNPKSARTLFVAALALYILWFGALVALAIVSADRPADAQRPRASARRRLPLPLNKPKD